MSTNLSSIRKKGFTQYQVETAIKVMMESKSVLNWVNSEVKFLGIDITTAEGKARYDNLRREAALRMIQ